MNGRKNVCVLLMAFAVMGVCRAQTTGESLGKMVDREGFGWMIGTWKGTTYDGGEMTLSYRWAVGKHAIIAEFKMGDYSTHGIIFLSPDDHTVHQLTVDSNGIASRAKWNIDEGKAISKTRRTNADGQTEGFVVTHEKGDDNTMKVELFGMEGDDISDYPWTTLDFKRLKSQPKKKAPAVKSS